MTSSRQTQSELIWEMGEYSHATKALISQTLGAQSSKRRTLAPSLHFSSLRLVVTSRMRAAIRTLARHFNPSMVIDLSASKKSRMRSSLSRHCYSPMNTVSQQRLPQGCLQASIVGTSVIPRLERSISTTVLLGFTPSDAAFPLG